MTDHPTSDILVDYLHGELSPQDDAFVHAHLATCDDCRTRYDVEAALTELLRSSARADERELPSLVSAAVWQQIREAQPGPLARLAALWRPAVAVPVAAVLVLGGWFASPLSHGSARPTIDATYYFQAHAAQAELSPLSERSGVQALETSMVAVPAASRGETLDGYAASGFDAVQ